jgi:polyisoprenyl-phosphate glycosyltransferase
MTEEPLVSIILSFRNEQEVIPELLRRLRAVLGPLPVRHELVFINDASSDRSRPLLEELADQDPSIKIINMSRRFGVTECIMAGLERCQGDAAICMDTDLQDPPELIPELLAKWREGADVVYTVRTARRGEPAVKMLATRIAYYLIHRLSTELDLKVEAGDFRLLSRRVVKELLRLKERNAYFRGLVTWVGFKQVPVLYERQPRAAGISKFGFLSRIVRDLGELRGPIGHLLSGLTSFSVFPLTVFLVFGALLLAGSAIALLAVIVLPLLQGGAPDSRLCLSLALMSCSGAQLLGIGTLGVYLGRVYNEVKDRPQYIVESTRGLDRPGGRDSDGGRHQG